MCQATLVFVFNDANQLLLCMKKRGFGEGKYNGAGGKVEPGESLVEAAIRELREEAGIVATTSDLEEYGLFHFSFPAKKEWDQDVTLFVMRGYRGQAIETEEMRPEWFHLDAIPYGQMWEDDAIWLPRVLRGLRVEYAFSFETDGTIRTCEKIR